MYLHEIPKVYHALLSYLCLEYTLPRPSEISEKNWSTLKPETIKIIFPSHRFFQKMALYHKWDVKNDFANVLQFFSLISDGLGSVRNDEARKRKVISVQ